MFGHGDHRRKHNDMVLQQGRYLPLKRALPQPRVKPHDAARLHRPELGRLLREVLPGQQWYVASC
jgi:hypothetical protein